MNKEQFSLAAGSLGALALLIGIFGGVIKGQFGPLFLTLVLVGLALILVSLYMAVTMLRVWINRRSTRYGTNLTIMILVAFAVVVFIETLSYNHYKQFDVTGDRLNSLSAQTRQILKRLERDDEKVQVVAFVRDSERKGYKDLLDLILLRKFNNGVWSSLTLIPITIPIIADDKDIMANPVCPMTL